LSLAVTMAIAKTNRLKTIRKISNIVVVL
jgi:hypothetical protein